jgi:hypothetical protein
MGEEAKMKFQVLQEEIPVYPEMRLDMPPMRILRLGDQGEIGNKMPVRNGQAWVEIFLPDKTRGYANAFSPVFLFKRVVTNQPATRFYKTPGHGMVIATLKKGAQLDFLNPVIHNGESWIRVKDRAGTTGYIEANTRTLQKARPTRLMAIRNIGLGILFSFIFTLLTLGNLNANSINWLEGIATGFVALLGLYQIFLGVSQWIDTTKE